jgi:hypothetical protein
MEAQKKETDVMTTHSTGATRSGSVVVGSVTLALGILFTAAVAYTYVLSLSDTFNPPNWARVIGLVWLPIGFGGVPIAYYFARTGESRQRGRLGVLIGLVGLAAFVALVITIG